MKKLLSLLLAALLLASLVPVMAEEAPALRWVSLGNGMPDNYDTWKPKVDAYLMEKIGVTLDLEVLSWGAYGEKRNAIINGGEYFDIIFTDLGSFYNDIAKGALLDIKPYLENATELKAALPEGLWPVVTVDDKIYAVPTLKDSAKAHYFVWDPAVVEKTGMDVTNLHTWESVEPVLLKMKEQGIASPYTMRGQTMFTDWYDFMSLGTVLMGVRFDDQERKLVPVLEQPEIMQTLKLLHKWQQEGIINADAATLAQLPENLPFTISQGWPDAWKVHDRTGITVLYMPPIFSNDSALGSANGVYAGTKYPEKSVEFLQLVNTDTKLRDMLCYGEEGVNFEYKDGLVVINKDKPWGWPRYTQGNHAILTPTTDDPNFLKNLSIINDAATPSVMLGFNVDRSELEDQLAYFATVSGKYSSELFTGTSDPEVLVPQLMAELRTGGFDEVIAEVQGQIDAHFAK